MEGGEAQRGVVELWDAVDRQLERPVTIQILSEEAAGDHDLRDAFLRHQQIACTIHNSPVQAVYDAGVWQSRPFSVMQKWEGTPANALYRPGYPPDVIRALAVTRQVAEGLQSCRDAGLTGWALSPEDVQIDSEGNAHFAIIDASLSQSNTEDDSADMAALSRLLCLIVTGDPEADSAKLRAAQVPEVVIGLLGRLDPQESNRVTAGAIATDIAAIEAAAVQPTQAHEANAAVVEPLLPGDEDPAVNTAPPIVSGSAEAPTLAAPVLTLSQPYNPPFNGATQSAPAASTLPLQASGAGGYAPPIEKARVTKSSSRALSPIFPIAAVLLILLLALLLFKTLSTPSGVEGQSVNSANSAATPSQSAALVPDVRGKSLDDARRIAGAAGLNLAEGDSAYDDTYPAGRVGSQQPAPGQQIQAGSAITVSLSLGPLPVVNQPAPNPQPPAGNPPKPPPKKGKGEDNSNDNKDKHK